MFGGATQPLALSHTHEITRTHASLLTNNLARPKAFFGITTMDNNPWSVHMSLGRTHDAAPQTPAGAPPPPSTPRAGPGAVVAAAVPADRAAATIAVPQRHALAPTQGQSSTQFTIQVAQDWLRGEPVFDNTDTPCIKDLWHHMEDARGAVDLESIGLPWRRWIRQRSDWEQIVGTGVVAIELRRLSAYRYSTTEMRTDIVVKRSDNTCVRLHLHEPQRAMRPMRIPSKAIRTTPSPSLL